MSGTVPLGRFVWYDLITSDVEGAADFYSNLVGWGTTPWEGDQPYLIWTNREVPLGGIVSLPEEARQSGAAAHWVAYVAVPDADATVAKALELGAKVLVSATDIPAAGRFAVLQDPQHAVFAVIAPFEEPPGHEGPPGIGEFSWHELATQDQTAAFDFYQKLFGWETADSYDMGEMGIYHMYGCPGTGTPLGGMFDKPKDVPSSWLLYVRVDDVNQAAAKVRELGGTVLNGPMEVPGGDMVAQCLDPQGAAFALHSAAE
ncbi:MAG: VOC family protein [Gemmatimonadota bacterium]|nr:MAG: VOC family protein [Gemmatimonadota bacterium]